MFIQCYKITIDNIVLFYCLIIIKYLYTNTFLLHLNLNTYLKAVGNLKKKQKHQNIMIIEREFIMTVFLKSIFQIVLRTEIPKIK